MFSTSNVSFIYLFIFFCPNQHRWLFSQRLRFSLATCSHLLIRHTSQLTSNSPVLSMVIMRKIMIMNTFLLWWYLRARWRRFNSHRTNPHPHIRSIFDFMFYTKECPAHLLMWTLRSMRAQAPNMTAPFRSNSTESEPYNSSTASRTWMSQSNDQRSRLVRVSFQSPSPAILPPPQPHTANPAD